MSSNPHCHIASNIMRHRFALPQIAKFLWRIQSRTVLLLREELPAIHIAANAATRIAGNS
jgi:hypothetical protein